MMASGYLVQCLCVSCNRGMLSSGQKSRRHPGYSRHLLPKRKQFVLSFRYQLSETTSHTGGADSQGKTVWSLPSLPPLPFVLPVLLHCSLSGDELTKVVDLHSHCTHNRRMTCLGNRCHCTRPHSPYTLAHTMPRKKTRLKPSRCNCASSAHNNDTEEGRCGFVHYRKGHNAHIDGEPNPDYICSQCTVSCDMLLALAKSAAEPR
jgi:hypothetical protein